MYAIHQRLMIQNNLTHLFRFAQIDTVAHASFLRFNPISISILHSTPASLKCWEKFLIWNWVKLNFCSFCVRYIWKDVDNFFVSGIFSSIYWHAPWCSLSIQLYFLMSALTHVRIHFAQWFYSKSSLPRVKKTWVYINF